MATSELTDIQRFYKNSTFFLTGTTGFIGKLYLEKVLRSLPVKKIFILVRHKKNTSPEKRFEQICTSPIFDNLKRTNPGVFQKVTVMAGDLSEPMLGLSPDDRRKFIEEVNVIVQCAATTRFDAELRSATFINVRSTRDLIILAKQVKKLKSFVYIGTAFSNSQRLEIDEKIYETKISAEKLIEICENLDNETLNYMTPKLIGEWPNTYTFTKQITEDLINRECRELPVCITRPTIVISTANEPIVGFVDNMFSLAGMVVGNALGLIRIAYYKNYLMDFVPADFVVNECIAAGWQAGDNFKPTKREEVPIYNISNKTDNPITQDETYAYLDVYRREVPSVKQQLYPLYFLTTCRYNYLFWRFFLHTCVAYMFDLFGKFAGNEPRYLKAVDRVHKFQESYEYFTTNQFFFHNDNTNKLLKKMTFADRTLFNFDMNTLNWNNYFMNYPKGLRAYLLGDPLTTFKEGKETHSKLLKQFLVFSFVLLVVLYGLGKVLLFRVLPVLLGMFGGILRSIVC